MSENKTLTLGSLFDGSGGFPLAGILAGVTPLWASEIEPFALRVTTARLPEMKHYGDVSKISGSNLQPVDIITFGSPCQDMSIAGKRSGLDGSRSSLFYEAIRIVKEMREKTNGEKPRWICWENVPGVFSSNKGTDFKAVLEAIIGIKEPGTEVPAPDKKGWPRADCYLGDGFSLAYRVLDAQYWGVPQRRARIFLVADFAGERAPEILFVSEGMSGYTPQGFRSWQGVACDSQDCVGTARQGGIAIVAFTQNQRDEVRDLQNRAGALASELGMKQQTYVLQGSMIGRADKNGPQGDGINEDVSFTLDTADRHAVAYCMTTGKYTQVTEEKTPTLMARDYKDPPIVNERTYRFDPQKKTEGSRFQEECASTLVIGTNPGYHNGVAKETREKWGNAKVAGTVAVGAHPSGFNGQDAYNDRLVLDPQEPFYIVRRLTPTECARLQGFPDWWCSGLEIANPTEEDIAFWSDVWETHRKVMGTSKRPKTEKQIIKWLKNPHSDSAEYKLWGNGVALPCVYYVLSGIVWAAGLQG